MELSVYTYTGDDSGKTKKLSEDIFGVSPNDHAIYLDVKQYLAHKRQGTHKSKERNEIAGSTKKIKKQKGTGTARAGSLKSPLFRSGGTIFGPRPRNYSIKLNTKLKRVARRSALSYKAQDNNIIIIEDFNFDIPKTTQYQKLLRDLNLSGKKTLFVLPENNDNIFLSSRNIQSAKVTTVDELNTYSLLNADSIIISEKSIDQIEKILS